MATLFEIALVGVGAAAVLIGSWTIATGHSPGWVWLARNPTDRYSRLWGIAALLLGLGAVIVVISWSSPYRLPAGPAVGFGLHLVVHKVEGGLHRQLEPPVSPRSDDVRWEDRGEETAR